MIENAALFLPLFIVVLAYITGLMAAVNCSTQTHTKRWQGNRNERTSDCSENTRNMFTINRS